MSSQRDRVRIPRRIAAIPLTWIIRIDRRIVLAPVNDPARRVDGHGNSVSYFIVGFAAFLIDTQASIDASSPSGWICATYLGPANKYSGGNAGGDNTKVYSLGLFK